MERHEKSPRFVAQNGSKLRRHGAVTGVTTGVSMASVEVFSQSAKAWLPGRVSLLAAPGKITVCYSLEAKLCAIQHVRCDSIHP